LYFIDPYSVLKIIDDKNENRSKEVYSMDYWQRHVELGHCHRQAMNYYNGISFE
jgi:hypothetical protein